MTKKKGSGQKKVQRKASNVRLVLTNDVNAKLGIVRTPVSGRLIGFDFRPKSLARPSSAGTVTDGQRRLYTTKLHSRDGEIVSEKTWSDTGRIDEKTLKKSEPETN